MSNLRLDLEMPSSLKTVRGDPGSCFPKWGFLNL